MSEWPRPRVTAGSSKGRLRRRLHASFYPLALIVGVAGLVLVAMSIQGEPVYDDPYILFRFAENLATGHGWSFNATALTDNAATSNLDVLLLAGGRFLGVNVPAFAAVVFFVTTVSAAVLTAFALQELGHRAAGVVAALLIASSPALTAVWGMESSLFLCLLAAALYSAVARHPAWVVGLLLGLLVLARPDGVVVGAILVIVFFVIDPTRRLNSRSWLELVISGGFVVAAWAAFAFWNLGALLPSTLEAKRAQAASGVWPTLLSSRGIGILYSDDSMRGLMGADGRAGQLVAASVAIAALVGLVALMLRAAAWQLALTLVASTLAILIIYGLVLRVPSYPWYWVLPIYTLLILAGMGVEAASSSLESNSVRVAAVALLAAALVAGSLSLIRTGLDSRRSDYKVLGYWLKDNAPSNATIAAYEFGKIGFFSERPMVDYLGLLDSPAITHVRRRDFTWWPSHYQPDYWITDRHGIDAQFASTTCFTEHFQELFETENFTVYQRISQVPRTRSC